MPKSLSERVGAKAKPRRRSRAAFLALRDEIRQAIADGWSKRAVWETLRDEGAIHFAYNTFLAYTRQLPEGAAPATTTRTSTTTPSSPLGFTFSATPKKEELF